ncbi:MAG TPA: hypothetical protein VFM01_02385 [Nakamurella sp.]|nr:hypothetical protein [Nakamurella sp.]
MVDRTMPPRLVVARLLPVGEACVVDPLLRVACARVVGVPGVDGWVVGEVEVDGVVVAVTEPSADPGSGVPGAGVVSAGTVTGPPDCPPEEASLAARTCGGPLSADRWVPPGSAKMTATRAATATSTSSTRR